MDRALVGTVVRHQIGSLIATVVDFGTMVACVEWLRLDPVVGTVIGATCGGISNFMLGRRWIFRSRNANYAAEAGRYAIVSGTSLGLNALGEYIVTRLLGLQYVIARLIVALAVSLLWNLPVQRHFVFRSR